MKEQHLDELFLTVFHEFTRMNFGSLLLEMTQGEFFVLFTIRRILKREPSAQNAVSVSKIAQMMNVSSPAISRMLRGLEGRGYLERLTDPKDRRSSFVRLTQEGTAIYLAERARLYAFAERVMRRLGEENTERLIQLSGQLRAAVMAELKETAQ